MSEYGGRPPIPPEDDLQSRLAFLESDALPRASEIWSEIGEGFVFIEARFHLADTQASRAGWALYDVDREARRAVRVIAGRGQLGLSETEIPTTRGEVERARRATPRSLLRPSDIRYGGFTLLRAEPGSTEFLLDAYGLVSAVLLAAPVQFVLTLSSILGWPMRVILRRRTRNGELESEQELSEEFEFHERDLRVGGRLPAGSRLSLRYKRPDGSELDIDLVTPGPDDS